MIDALEGGQMLECRRRPVSVDVVGWLRRANLSDCIVDPTMTYIRVGYGYSIAAASMPANTKLTYCRNAVADGLPCVETFTSGYGFKITCPSLHNADSLTLALQMRLKELPEGDNRFRVLCIGNYGYYDRGATIEVRSDGGVTLHSRKNYNNPKWDDYVDGPSGSVQADKWVHVGWTWDAETATATLYVDGRPVASGPSRMFDGLNYMYLVYTGVSSGWQPMGCWGDWRLYSRCLTPDEMKRVCISTRRN